MKVVEELTEEKRYFIEKFREKLIGRGIDVLVEESLGEEYINLVKINLVKRFLEWVVSEENIDSIKEIFNYQQQLLRKDEVTYESVKDFLTRNRDELGLDYNKSNYPILKEHFRDSLITIVKNYLGWGSN